jgi:hypothetical protein
MQRLSGLGTLSFCATSTFVKPFKWGPMETRRQILRNAWRETGAVMHHDPAIGMLAWESGLEKQLLRQLCCCVDVVGLETQAAALAYDSSNPLRRYTGDVVAQVATQAGLRKYLVEVKSIRFVNADDIARFTQIESAAHVVGYDGFALVVDIDIRREPALSIASALKFYAVEPVTNSMLDALTALLQRGPMTIGSLRHAVANPTGLVQVFSLLARNELTLDWSAPLDHTALIGLPDRPYPQRKFLDVINLDWQRRFLELRDLVGAATHQCGFSTGVLGQSCVPPCVG